MLRRLSTVFALGLLVGGCENLPKINFDSSEQVYKTAKEITVVIDGCGEAGSGVVFKKDDKTYSVLTAYHVVKKAKGNCLILTSDGIQHKVAASDATVPVAGVDLAVLTFVSDKTYKVAKMGDSDKAVEGSSVYVAGSPGVSEAIKQRTMLIPDGRIIGLVPQPSEAEGYGLIYNNNTSRGMSGGPVLNQKGELIGIHGSGDKQDGIDAGRKLGIPIKIFLNPESLTAKGSQPKDAKDYYNQGLARQNQEDFKGAIADFSKAIEFNPNYADAYYARGYGYKKLENKEKAIADYSKVIAINPKGTVAYLGRAIAYYDQGKRKEAKADYDRAIELNSNYADAYVGRGLVYYDLQEIINAINDYSKAININPNYDIAYNNRGSAYRVQGEKMKAINDYSKAIELNPNSDNAYNNRGDVYYN